MKTILVPRKKTKPVNHSGHKKKYLAFEKKVLEAVTINDEGHIVYNGRGSEISRTGSPVRLLIRYFLFKDIPKPLDQHIFEALLKQQGLDKII